MEKSLGSRWEPATDKDKELAAAWKAGDIVVFQVRKPRNGQHHKLMFALIGLVWQNLPEKFEGVITSKDGLLDELKFQVGHVDTHRTLGGKTVYKPQSIAFDAMDQAAFRVFFDDVVEVICKYFLPGIPAQQVKDEAYSMIDEGRNSGS